MIEVWKSKVSEEWFWHYKSKNGRIIAIGGEGYKRKTGVMNMLKKLFTDVHDIYVIEDPNVI